MRESATRPQPLVALQAALLQPPLRCARHGQHADLCDTAVEQHCCQLPAGFSGRYYIVNNQYMACANAPSNAEDRCQIAPSLCCIKPRLIRCRPCSDDIVEQQQAKLLLHRTGEFCRLVKAAAHAPPPMQGYRQYCVDISRQASRRAEQYVAECRLIVKLAMKLERLYRCINRERIVQRCKRRGER